MGMDQLESSTGNVYMGMNFKDKMITNLAYYPSLRSLSLAIASSPFTEFDIPIRPTDSKSSKFQRCSIWMLWILAFG